MIKLHINTIIQSKLKYYHLEHSNFTMSIYFAKLHTIGCCSGIYTYVKVLIILAYILFINQTLTEHLVCCDEFLLNCLWSKSHVTFEIRIKKVEDERKEKQTSQTIKSAGEERRRKHSKMEKYEKIKKDVSLLKFTLNIALSKHSLLNCSPLN